MVRAWTVRGGEQGQREQYALDKGLVIAGWEEVGDLTGCESIDDLGTILARAYSDEPARTVENWKHQLWRFIAMQIDDLVVMPRKFRRVVAIGRLTGPYEYHSDAAPGFRHVRPAEWIRTDVERAAIGGDLRDSMGAFLTVSELSRRNAAQRVQALAETGADPGYDGGVEPPADSDALERDVTEEGTRQLTARDLMSLWGWQRRTAETVDFVDRALAERGMRVDPHFTEVQLDGLVTVSPQTPAVAEQDTKGTTAGGPDTSASGTSADADTDADLSWRIGSLPIADKVVTVSAQAPLGDALLLMVEGDFSQLPVVNQYNVLRGVITWESIAQAQLAERKDTVGEAMDPHPPRTAQTREELFSRIGDIQHRGFLLIVDEENAVRGILTASDLSHQLRLRVEPFTLLEEVERRLRRATGHLTDEDLPDHVRKRSRAGNLSLGQYPFVVADNACWKKLGWPFGQHDMANRLKAVADYRNRLAHWDIDAPDQEAEALVVTRKLLKLLKVVDRDPTP
ncbi:CBS domain-containing protein [Streptomyces sp. NPDC127033]|uniref:CBS domain-containing protein n=1 Tax=Streptomyces sp. NPDC127033 TaxID=3347110 RepID=UPI0036523FFD